MPLWAAFITGVTSGGLSCLAVQGGLLATALTQEHETGDRRRTAHVLVLFLSAKWLAYLALGALLGAVGTVFQLSPALRAALLIVIGLFMVGNALRMLNVHPIFRYFALEPPVEVRRFLRQTARRNEATTPLLLGALTVLLPCGVTQAMMALALSTGDAWQAMGLMGAFTLGSNLVFFAISYLAFQVSGLLEKRLNLVMAVVLLVVGCVTLDAGANLAGAPFSLTRLLSAGTVPVTTPAPTATASAEVVIEVRNQGYVPDVAHAPAGQEVKLTFVTDNVFSCSRALVIPALHIEEVLPDTGAVSFTVPPQAPGKVLRYSCSMGMYVGSIVFDQ